MKDPKGLGYNEKVMKMCEELYLDGFRTNHLLACIIDICQDRHKKDESPDSLFCYDRARKVRISRSFKLIEHSIIDKGAFKNYVTRGGGCDDLRRMEGGGFMQNVKSHVESINVNNSFLK